MPLFSDAPPLFRCPSLVVITCSCLQTRWIEWTTERGRSPFNAPSFVRRCIQHCGIHLSAGRSYFISIYICLDRYSNRIKFVRNRSKYPLSNLLTSRRVFFVRFLCAGMISFRLYFFYVVIINYFNNLWFMTGQWRFRRRIQIPRRRHFSALLWNLPFGWLAVRPSVPEFSGFL